LLTVLPEAEVRAKVEILIDELRAPGAIPEAIDWSTALIH
jgi:hypothetical protein